MERSRTERRAVVFAGGEPVDRSDRAAVAPGALVVAADSGLEAVYDLGLRPDVVVGDMDSVAPATLARSRRDGAEVERFPTAKDATDLELAIDAAVARGATAVTVLGGHGGRLDHLLGNALLLAADRYAALDLRWRVGPTTVVVARPERPATIQGAPGELVSLLAVGGPARGVRTTGLRWRLDGATLTSGSTRGISNEMTGEEATVALGGGVLLVVHERSPR